MKFPSIVGVCQFFVIVVRGDKPQRTQSCAEKYGIKRLVNNYLEHSALSASSAVKKHE